MMEMEEDELQDGDLRENIRKFPSIFHLEKSRTSQNKLSSLNQSIEDEVNNVYDGDDEMILKLNFWTWIKFQLGENELAIKVNERVMEMTKSEDLIALSNRALLMMNAGDEFEAQQCLQTMIEMKERSDFELLWAAAEAGQAYCYQRLGGAKNMEQAIAIFEKVTTKVPYNYLWKFKLGLGYRRGIHINVYTSSQQKVVIRDYVEKAVKYLFEVGEKSEDVILKGRAYAELAALSRNARWNFDKHDCDAILRHKSCDDLCDDALKLGSQDPWVLTTCGRILRFDHLEKATALLETSVKLKKSSTAYHHLGRCYEEKAREKEREVTPRAAEASSRDGPVPRSMSCDEPGRLNLWRSPLREEQESLNVDNEYVKKAIECFQRSIKTSNEVNLAVVYDLGLLLKSCGQLEIALKQFNKIINSPNFNDGNHVTLITAYEQAGLCLLELHNKTVSSAESSTGQAGNKRTSLYDEAERKLTRAVGLAAELASKAPDIKDHAKNVWNAFRTLESELESKEPSPTKSKRLIRLLKLVQEHGKLLSVVQKLLSMSEDDQIDDPVVIRSSLESYLALGQYENALTFLNMVQTRPAAVQGKSKSWSDDPLFTKVYLDAAAARFKSGSGDAKLLFKKIFDSKIYALTSYSHFGQKLVQNKNQCEVTENSPDQEDNKSAGEKEQPRSHEKKGPMTDVLILYDDCHDLDRSQDGVTSTARTLQSVMSNIFGLDACWNLQGCSCAGVKMELQLQEMLKSKVVIVLLGTEEMSGYFSGLLAYVPCLKVESERPPLPKVLLATTDETVTVKQTLQYFHDSICLKEIMPHLQQKTGTDQSKSSTACSTYGTAEGSPQNDADISTSAKTAAVRRTVSCALEDIQCYHRNIESLETMRKVGTSEDSPPTSSVQASTFQTTEETPLSPETRVALSTTVDSSTCAQIADAKKFACSSSQKVPCCDRNTESRAEDRCAVTTAIHDDYSKESAGTMLDTNLAAGTSTEIISSDKIPEVQTTKGASDSPVMYDQGEVITTRKAVSSPQLLPIIPHTATAGGEACPADISVMTAVKQAEGSDFSCEIFKATEVDTLCKMPCVSEIDSSCELSMISNINTCQSLTSTPDIDPCQPISSSDTGICPPDTTLSPDSIHEQQRISALMTLFTFLSGTSWEQKKAEL